MTLKLSLCIQNVDTVFVGSIGEDPTEEEEVDLNSPRRGLIVYYEAHSVLKLFLESRLP